MSEQINNNVRIWDQLGKTDPAHTKQFQRSGGFRGTAIKPMWCNLRMTEFFGPCGIGWGMDKPSFETREADKEMLVFCTVGVWYVENGTRGLVYGVGGDKYVISQQSGLRASDEAFKAAYTDAIGNAMKFIGVAADVHMGLFDDNKYVADMKAEFGGQKQAKPHVQPINQQLRSSLAQTPPVDDDLSFLNDDRPPVDYQFSEEAYKKDYQEPVAARKPPTPSVGAPINPKLTKVLYAIAMGKQWDVKGYRKWINEQGYSRDSDIPQALFDEIKARLEAA